MLAEVQPVQYSFNIQQYHRMGEAGILPPTQRVELLGGVIYRKSRTKSKEAACRSRANHFFTNRLADNALVSIKHPIVLNDFSEPEPDIALLVYRDDYYEERLPKSSDVLLLIEVSEAPLRFDKEIKLPLYAESGIPEVWIIDLKKGSVETYSNLQNGSYQQWQILKRGQTLIPQQLPFLTVAVQELIG